jgi:tetratricopeptide (TPR) repeat protein
LGLAIALLTLASYWSVRGNAFVDFDDHEYVVENPHLDGQLSLGDLKSAFATPYNSNWAPLSQLSLIASDALHGPDPGAYALTNVLLHTLASVLLLFAFGQATGRWPESAFVAAVFAVHPLHVESVAWISQRKEVLAGAFWMAALAAYPRAARTGSSVAHAGVFAFGLLALLSKATAVALPITLFLLDLWPLDRLRSKAELWRALREKLPLIAAALVVAAVTYRVQTEAGANATAQSSLGLRLLNATRSYAIYIAESLWPTDLAYFHPFPTAAVLMSPASWAAFAFVVTTTGLALVLLRRRPIFAMGWLWFIATLIPMIGLVRVGGQAHADRYSYIAQTGLVVLLAFALPDALLAQLSDGRVRERARAALGIAAAIAVAGLAWATRVQVAVWRDSVTLFSHAIAVTEDNAHAHRFLAVSLWTRGESAAAARHLQEALRIRPDWGDARLVWATALLQQGRLDAAAGELERAGRDGAERGLWLAATGVLAERRGDSRAAAEAYEASLEHRPDDWEVLNNLAWIRAASPIEALRDPIRAVELAERAANRKPEQAYVQGTLAAAYASAGRSSEAVAAQERALAILRAQGESEGAEAFARRLAAYRAGGRPWQTDPSAP